MLEFKYQIKHMGFLFYVPIIVAVLLIPFILLMPDNAQKGMFIALEFIVIPMAAWWAIYQLYFFYHQGAEEILVHFFSKVMLINYAKFIGVSLVLNLLLTGIYSIKFQSDFLILFFLFFGQSVLFSSVGLLIAVIFKDIEIAIVLLTLYTSTEIITFGELLPGFHLFVFDLPVSLRDVMINNGFYLFISIILLAVSYKVSSTMERNIL